MYRFSQILFLYTCLQVSVSASELQDLSYSDVWLALGVYTKTGSGFRSEVHSESFFIDPNGRDDPYAELSATINAFESGDKEAICKYRGRLRWLVEVWPNADSWAANVHCKEFNQWSNNGQASLSLVFATGYFKNPASYYGHILLKVNNGGRGLVDNTVNYGARVPDNENLIPYIFRGLVGSYKASYTSTHFYTNVATFNETDQRDMWEYELDLKGYEYELVLGHAWELLKEEYTYLFLSKNCVYRIGELLSVTGHKDAYKIDKYWVAPQDLIQSLANYRRQDGKSLFKNVSYLPSRQSRLYARYNRLSAANKNLVHQYVDDLEQLSSSSFNQLNQNEQFEILDVLLEYFKYLEISGFYEEESAKNYNKVLAARFRLPIGQSSSNFYGESKPHEGRRSSYFSVGGVYHSTEENYGVRVSLRPAYYDALDSDHGHVPFSRLKMGDVAFRLEDSKVVLEKLIIADIQSIRTAITGLPGDRSMSWGIKLGFEQERIGCESCIGFSGLGELGMSKSLFGATSSVSVFGGVGALSNSVDKEALFYQGAMQFITDMGRVKLQARYAQRYSMFDNKHDGGVSSLQARVPISLNTDIRVSYESSNESEWSVTLGKYW